MTVRDSARRGMDALEAEGRKPSGVLPSSVLRVTAPLREISFKEKKCNAKSQGRNDAKED